MNTNIKTLSMEELENVSGGITAKKVKKVIKEVVVDVALASLVACAIAMAVHAGKICYECINGR
ncbi:MAG: bacteriocin [Clostridia bacterium]|nr:bacteriocin [Clostridia bacterium]